VLNHFINAYSYLKPCTKQSTLCDLRISKPWVLALDMKNMTVKDVQPFSAKRTLGLARGYAASRISAYLKPALGN
jgi:hypothetical protein